MYLRFSLCLLICLFPFCSVFSEEEPALSVGVLLCLTGECAEWGENSLMAIELATKEINMRGGVLGRKIELVVQDTREASSGASAVTVFQSLRAQNDIKYFIGPTWTPAGLALAPIVSQLKDVVMVSPSLGVADFNEYGENLFNTWPHDDRSSRALAQYGFEQNWTKAAVFSSQQPWEQAQGNVFAQTFKQLGGNIVAHLEPLPDARDLKTEALRIRQSAPDVVFLSNTNRLGIAARELRSIGYHGPILALLLDETRLRDGRGALDGAITARYPEASFEFQKSFQEQFALRPGITADTAYDALMLYARAIKQAGTTNPLEVKKVMQRIEFEGVSGKILFNSNGGIERDPLFFRAKGLFLYPLENS